MALGFRSTDAKEALTTVAATITKVVAGLNDTVRQAASDVTSAIVKAQSELNTKVEALHGRLQLLQNGSMTAASGEQLKQDIARLHGLMEGWRAEAAMLRGEAAEARRAYEAAIRQAEPVRTVGAIQPEEVPSTAEPADAAQEPPRDDAYGHLLDRAAGIAYAEITCHRDTWSFLVERSARTEHFRLPAPVEEDKDGIIEANVSGRTLLSVIDALWHTRDDTEASATTRALAGRVYERITEALKELHPSPDGGSSAAHIIIDNRPPKLAAAPADETAVADHTQPSPDTSDAATD